MTKNQLKASIEKITQAIELINTTEGYYYDKAHQTTALMIEQRSRMQKELSKIELTERQIKHLETQYSVLEARLNGNLDVMSDLQINALRDQLDKVYDKIKELRGE